MNALLFLCGFFLALGSMVGTTASAQTNSQDTATFLVLNGTISQNACNFSPSAVNLGNPLAVELPTLQTTMLLNAPFSPVLPVQMRFQLSADTLSCLKTVLGNNPNPILFDSAFAAVVPRSGLLRNSATVRPAQNVLVQLGQISEQGTFTPIDLSQPQALTLTLPTESSSTSANLTLNLGVRYVASRYVPELYGALGNINPGASDVTSGNVSIFLPFLLTLK
jgi:hypothetical protein